MSLPFFLSNITIAQISSYKEQPLTDERCFFPLWFVKVRISYLVKRNKHTWYAEVSGF